MDVGLFELSSLLLLLSVVLLFLVFHVGALELSLVVIHGLLVLDVLDQLVVEVLEVLKVGNDAAFVFFLASLLERVVVDLEDLEVVAQLVEIAHGFVK